MIDPPFNLDLIEDQLIKFREQCMDLAAQCVEAPLYRGVPMKALYAYHPDTDTNIIWQAAPDVYQEYIEFNGEVWRHQDTDHVSFTLNRRVLDGTMSVGDWASEFKAQYDKEQANKAMSATFDALAKEKAETERRRQLYLELKQEFDP